jgi:two-component system, NtrC family, response regulator AtoC
MSSQNEVKASGRILIVDDDPEFRVVAQNLVELEGFDTTLAANGTEAVRTCKELDFEAVLLDLRLGDTSGIDVLRELKRLAPDVPVIVITAHGSMESAAEAVQAEAFDYIGKPFRSAELLAMLNRARDWRAQRRAPLPEVREPQIRTSIVGRSAVMVAVYRVIARVAATDSTVLISGESGTGKELIARALHESSPRKPRPFVPVNCGAFTETLLESELFGHVRGAFTGAAGPHRGIFETASGGTIFLDEISETSPAFQVKLLRVLQEQEVRPVGASDTRRVDVRIVAATNRRIAELLTGDDFRRDLLYRLSVINIELPPLRERREDIPLLVEHFLNRTCAKLGRRVNPAPQTVEWLCDLDWPGNVRELENAVERAVTLNTSGKLLVEDFTQFTPTPLNQPKSLPLGADVVDGVPQTLEEVERNHILTTLRYTRGNKLRAAELLGIGRYSLYRKAERLGIDLDKQSTDSRRAAGENVNARK